MSEGNGIADRDWTLVTIDRDLWHQLVEVAHSNRLAGRTLIEQLIVNFLNANGVETKEPRARGFRNYRPKVIHQRFRRGEQ